MDERFTNFWLRVLNHYNETALKTYLRTKVISFSSIN